MKRNCWNKQVPLLLQALVLFMLLGACSPARKVIRTPLKEEGTEHIFTLLKKHELKFDWLTAKFSATIEIDKKETSMNGLVRIIRDSIIWVSLNPGLGIEAARILITQDSVKFLNRIDNTFLVADFGFINANLNSGFDFDMLQALIVGNDLSYYENDKFRGIIDDMLYKLNTIGRRKLKKYVRNASENLKVLVQSIWIDPESGKIRKVNIKELDKENKKLEAVYSGFQPINSQLVPMRSSFHISSEKQIRISLEYSKVRLDEPAGIPFSIPEKYTRLIKN